MVKAAMAVVRFDWRSEDGRVEVWSVSQGIGGRPFQVFVDIPSKDAKPPQRTRETVWSHTYETVNIDSGTSQDGVEIVADTCLLVEAVRDERMLKFVGEVAFITMDDVNYLRSRNHALQIGDK